ncbi:MAG: hypothetical protein JXC31_06510 [Acholeplasmataceae bacterium]|nr:hypothetical protein [Acholeplasmataceae bacterium]
MKKIYLILIIVMFSLLSSCKDQGKELTDEFFRNLESTQFYNTFEFDGINYEIYLSANSANVYYVTTSSTEYQIYVKEERSFTYLLDDNDSTEYDLYRNTYLHYKYNKNTKEYFQIDNLNEVKIEADYSGDNLTQILESISTDFGERDQITLFSNLYNVIKELYFLSSSPIVSGNEDIQYITLSIDKQTLINQGIGFKSHLSQIYNPMDYAAIINSIEQSPFSTVNVGLIWNKQEMKLYPIIQIYKNQNEYYIVHPSLISE